MDTRNSSRQQNFFLARMYLLHQFANLRLCYQGSIIPSAEPSLGVEGLCESVRMVASAAFWRRQTPDTSYALEVRLMPTVEQLDMAEQPLPTLPTQSFRLDVPLHNLLLEPAKRPLLQPAVE